MASLPNPSPLPRLLSSRFAETIARDETDLDDDDLDTEVCRCVPKHCGMPAVLSIQYHSIVTIPVSLPKQKYPIPATLREHEELYFGVARRQLTDNQSISSVRFEQCALA
jgi:hypothetical protein